MTNRAQGQNGDLVKLDLDMALVPDLSAHRVVIPGGTGSVGEGIVRAWLRAGAEVVVPSRTAVRAQQLAALMGSESPERLRIMTGDYTTFDSAEQMAKRIEAESGPVTDVVASIGGWWQGRPLWEVREEEWQRFFIDLATAHVAQVRAWIPRLPSQASYQLILGGSATTPVPGASIINMEQAGLLMMRSVLSTEVGDARRIVSAVLGPVATRTRSFVDPDWVSADEVGLLTTGVAASTEATGVDMTLSGKEQMLEHLRALQVYPSARESDR